MGESHKHSKRSQNQLKMYDFTYLNFLKEQITHPPKKPKIKKQEISVSRKWKNWNLYALQAEM